MAGTEQVLVPDIGDFDDVPVIEVLVSVGDEVAAEDPLVVLESDKATMEVPSPSAGKIASIEVAVGDKVKEGTPIVQLEVSGGNGAAPEAETAAARHRRAQDRCPGGDRRRGGDPGRGAGRAGRSASCARRAGVPGVASPQATTGEAPAYASPGVRRLARELGVDLTAIRGTGRKGRITKEDVQKPQPREEAAPKAAPSGGTEVAGLNLAPWPKLNFERYGEVERQPLTRIQKISGPNLARNWVMIPHVTHNDEADITELEAFRKRTNGEQSEAKVTMVALLAKAVVASLKAFPVVNSSLDGDDLVLKRYYNIGFAADTPNGLVVPVIKDADKKGILEIATGPDDAVQEGARRQAGAGRDGRRDVHDLLAGRHRRHELHADRQRSRGRDPRRHAQRDEAGLERQRVRAAADGPALAVLRPSRDRRRARRPLRRAPGEPAVRSAKGAALMEVKVPDIGDFDSVPVIEVLVAVGDEVAVEDPLVVLESDKATMEVPSPEAGKITDITVAVGDKVSEGSVILSLETAGSDNGAKPATDAPAEDVAEPKAPEAPAADVPDADVKVQVAVLGGGPGGYTAAFRAADLGLTVALIDRGEQLGGVCLNVGCIPSKALLHVAKVMTEAAELGEAGIAFEAPKIDVDKLRAFKDGVVGRLTGGLESLAKQRKVQVVRGTGEFTSPNTIQVGDTERRLRALHHRRGLRGRDAPVPARRTTGSSTPRARSRSTGSRRSCWSSAAASSAWRWRRSTTRSARRSPSSSCSTS